MTRAKFYKAFLVLAFLGLSNIPTAKANCTGSSPNWTATADLASVQACVNSAVNGDTITVAAGTATWSSPLSWSGKNFSLIGAGIGQTVITLSGNINADQSVFRISGFTFNFGSGVYINVSYSNGWRIDHNALTRTNWDIVILAYGNQPTPMEGLIDHNTDTYGRIDIQGEDTSRGGRDRWAEPLAMGTNHAVYIEDNTINFPDGSTGGSYGNYADGNQGCRMVVRFNTVLGSRVEFHGVQGENQDGCMLLESYNNTMTQPSTPNYRPYLIRGGTGVVFHNSSDGKYLNNTIDIDGPRLSEDSIASQVPNWQFCDGTTHSSYLTTPGVSSGTYTSYPTAKSILIDGGGTGGYPCRDQIGRGTNASLWDYTSAAPAQAFVPAYIWKNTQPTGEIPVIVSCETSGDVLCTNQVNNLIVPNRDFYLYNASFDGTSGVGEGPLANRPSTCTTGVAYWATDQGNWNQSGNGLGQGVLYKCTSTNSWTVYYTPYTYPHPLQAGTTKSSVQPPTNLNAVVQ